MWVRSEYANELAVLSAWLTVLLPWSGSAHTRTEAGLESDILFLRFPFFELQFRSPAVVELDGVTAEVETLENTYAGTELFGNVFATTPPSSLAFYEGALWQASLLWTVAAVGFALAVLFSLALYLREGRVAERLSVTPVRLMGALLGVGALGTAGASAVHYTARDTVGLPVPAGVLVVAALAAVLLRTEEVASSDDEANSESAESSA